MNKLSELGKQFFENGKVDDCPIIDMHGHMGPFYEFRIPVTDANNTVKCMDRAGVEWFVFSHHASIFSCLGNEEAIKAVREFPNRLKAYCGLNPNYTDQLKKELDTYDNYQDVYIGLKFLADYHKCKLSHKRYELAWEFANSRNLPILIHTWGKSLLDGYEEVSIVAERYKNTKIILGHSIHGDWDEAIEIAQRFPNTYLELCSVMDEEQGILERFVDELGSERILFGTDFPWFDFHYYIGAILGARINDEDRRNIFYRNAQKLLSP